MFSSIKYEHFVYVSSNQKHIFIMFADVWCDQESISKQKEENHYTFTRIPQEHWSIGMSLARPGKHLRNLDPPVSLDTAQFITTKLYSLMVLLV